MITGSTPISQFPTGTIDNLYASYPLSVGMLSTPQTIRATLLQTAQAFGAILQPSGTFPIETKNHLINGGFVYDQRHSTATGTVIATDTYSADRWKFQNATGTTSYQRLDATSETGLTSQYYGQYKKQTVTGKFVVAQIVEGVNSVPLRGRTVIFQAQMKASSSKTIRMGILELSSSGTIDTIPSSLVATYGADTVDPTFGSNVAVITAAESKSVTTSWQNFYVSVTIPSTSKNVICAIWTNSGFAANDILSIAEAGLYIASSTQPWKPRLAGDELVLVQRYCNAFRWNGSNLNLCFGNAYATTNSFHVLSFPTMRTSPTTSFSGAASDYKSSNGAGSGVANSVLPSATSPGDNTLPDRITIYTTVASGLTVGQGSAFQLSTANAAVILSAEL